MNTQDLLNILLAVGFLIIVGCIAYVTFYLVQALRSVTRLSDTMEQTTQEVRDKLQMKALSMIPSVFAALVSRLLRRR